MGRRVDRRGGVRGALYDIAQTEYLQRLSFPSSQYSRAPKDYWSSRVLFRLTLATTSSAFQSPRPSTLVSKPCGHSPIRQGFRRNMTMKVCCPECRWEQMLDLSLKISLLKAVGFFRRDKSPVPEIVDQLYKEKQTDLFCPQCGELGLRSFEPSRTDQSIEEDDAQWGGSRKCIGCGTKIPSLRLEILPDTQQCTQCAASGRTSMEDEREFCPKCGSQLQLEAIRNRGLARYEMRCKDCGYH